MYRRWADEGLPGLREQQTWPQGDESEETDSTCKSNQTAAMVKGRSGLVFRGRFQTNPNCCRRGGERGSTVRIRILAGADEGCVGQEGERIDVCTMAFQDAR